MKYLEKLQKLFIYSVLFGLVIFAIFPIVYTIFGSFKSNQEFLLGGSSLLPKKWMFSNYARAWNKADFSRYTYNSLYYSGLSTIGVVIITSMMAYCLERVDFFGKKLIETAFTLTLFIAGATTVYPVFELCVKLGINNSLNGLILVSVSSMQVLGTFLIRGYLKTIPRDIEESARIDGCSFFRTFWNIVFPLIKPIIAMVAILTFQVTWNNYMLPMAFTLSDKTLRTLTVGVVALKGEVDGTSSWNLINVGSSIALVPVTIVFILMNKQIIGGITAGSVKG